MVRLDQQRASAAWRQTARPAARRRARTSPARPGRRRRPAARVQGLGGDHVRRDDPEHLTRATVGASAERRRRPCTSTSSQRAGRRRAASPVGGADGRVQHLGHPAGAGPGHGRIEDAVRPGSDRVGDEGGQADDGDQLTDADPALRGRTQPATPATAASSSPEVKVVAPRNVVSARSAPTWPAARCWLDRRVAPGAPRARPPKPRSGRSPPQQVGRRRRRPGRPPPAGRRCAARPRARGRSDRGPAAGRRSGCPSPSAQSIRSRRNADTTSPTRPRHDPAADSPAPRRPGVASEVVIDSSSPLVRSVSMPEPVRIRRTACEPQPVRLLQDALGQEPGPGPPAGRQHDEEREDADDGRDQARPDRRCRTASSIVDPDGHRNQDLAGLVSWSSRLRRARRAGADGEDAEPAAARRSRLAVVGGSRGSGWSRATRRGLTDARSRRSSGSSVAVVPPDRDDRGRLRDRVGDDRRRRGRTPPASSRR